MADEPVMTPITPDEGATAIPPKATPFVPKPLAPTEASASAAPAAPATPAAPAAPAASAATVRLKPVIRKPMIHKPVVGGARPPATPAPVAPAPAAAAPKKATQNLKSVTGPIPAQAVLRKTGIIAEGILTPAQQQAAKSKTSRISLESAIGVDAAPAATPLKTIRLRRPTDLKPQPLKPAAPAPLAAAPEVPAADAPTLDPAAAPAAEPAPSVTQKRTLKLHRPAMGVKPPAPTMGAAPAGNAAADVADIADIPDLPTLGVEPVAGGGAKSAGVPTWVAAMSLVTSIAALLVISTLVYFFCKEGIAPDGQEANANTSYVISL